MTPPKITMVSKKLSYDLDSIRVDTPRSTRSSSQKELVCQPCTIKPPTSGVDLIGLEPRRLFPDVDDYCLDDELSITSEDSDLAGEMQVLEKEEKTVEPDTIILNKELFVSFICRFRCSHCSEKSQRKI
jgi:hypothetical protein